VSPAIDTRSAMAGLTVVGTIHPRHYEYPARAKLCRLSADGRTIAVAGGLDLENSHFFGLGGPQNLQDQFGVVVVWRSDRENAPLVLRGLANRVEYCQIKEDGSIVAVAANGSRRGGDDRSVIAWDCRTGKKLGSWNLAVQPIKHLALTADGICVAGSGNTLFWLSLGKAEVEKRREHDGVIRQIRSFSRGDFVLVGDSKNMLLCIASIEPRPEIRHHTSAVRAVDVTPDGREVISGDMDGRVLRVGRDSPDAITSLKATRPLVEELRFLPQGNGYLAIAVERDIHHLDNTRSDIGVDAAGDSWRVGVMKGEVSFFTVLPCVNTAFIAHGIYDVFGAPAGMWPEFLPNLHMPKNESFNADDLKTRRPVPNIFWRNRLIKLDFDLPLRPENIRFRVLHDDLPRLCKNSFVTPDGQYLVGTGVDRMVRVINLQDGHVVSQVDAHLECITPDGSAVICRMPYQSARLVKLNVPLLALIEDFGKFSNFHRCALTNRGTCLVLGGEKQTRVVNVVSRSNLIIFPASLQLTPSHGKWFGISPTPSDLVLVDSETLLVFAGYSVRSKITAIATALESDFIVIGCDDGGVHYLEIVR